MDNKIYGEVSLTCPVCSAHFTTLLPAVPLIPSARRSDLKPLFEDNIDHFASLIQTCPVCMFAAWPCSFGHHSEAVDSLIERCTSLPGDRPLPVISSVEKLTVRKLGSLHLNLLRLPGAASLSETGRRCLMAARCHDAAEEVSEARDADYFLRAYWAVSGRGNPFEENTFLVLAMERFQKLAADNMLQERERTRFLYLAGELARRHGDFVSAVDALSVLDEREFDLEAPPDDPEEIFLCEQASRMLSLAAVQSAVDAKVWDFSEALLSEAAEWLEQKAAGPEDGLDADEGNDEGEERRHDAGNAGSSALN